MPSHHITSRSGKVMTVLIVIIAILLVSLTSISLFFFQKEIEKRKDFETKLEASRASEIRLDTELQDLKKEKFFLEEKNKELDEKVEDLTSEVELEQGISKQLKAELATVKQQLDDETQKNQKLQDQLQRVADLEQENITFRSQYEEAKSVREELEKKALSLEAKNQELSSKIAELEKTVQGYVEQGLKAVKAVVDQATAQAVSVPQPAQEIPAKNPASVGLGKIVVADQTSGAQKVQGRVLTVDTETHFLIVNIGAKAGLKQGSVLSVYRADKYLGDVRVTQLQDEMAAADFISPLNSRDVRKDDRVTLK